MASYTIKYKKGTNFSKKGKIIRRGSYNKKYYRKAVRSAAKKQMNISRGLTIQKQIGFAQTQIVKMRYAEIKNIGNTQLTGIGSYIFRANDIYDPDVTGTGHQPKSADQWAVFYNHFIVLGSKITVKFIAQNSSTSSAPGIVGIMLSDQSTLAYTDVTGWMEDPRFKYKGISQSGGSKDTVVCTKYFSANKFYGVTDVRDNVEQYGGDNGASGPINSPDELAYYQVIYASQSASATPSPLMQVTIEYIVYLTGPKDIAQS